MKIAVFNPKSDFSRVNQKRLSSLGNVVYTASNDEYPVKKLIKFVQDAKVLAADPDNLGGFERAKDKLTAIMETLPDLKGLALSTTAYGWVDLDYCKEREILVCNIPGYSRESVAEHTLALLLCLAKRIIVLDRRTQKGQYKIEMGFELKGKTLGIIGLGNIGSRVAELANAIGMNVIAYSRSTKKQKGVTVKSFERVLKESDAVSLHVVDSHETEGMIGKNELELMKDKVIIVNTVDRNVVNEGEMAKAIKSGKVFGYVYEAEDLTNTPLAKLENAVGIKGFGWYTKEALDNLFEIWVSNIVGIAKGKPINVVN